jgi:hypothetical protein
MRIDWRLSANESSAFYAVRRLASTARQLALVSEILDRTDATAGACNMHVRLVTTRGTIAYVGRPFINGYQIRLF